MYDYAVFLCKTHIKRDTGNKVINFTDDELPLRHSSTVAMAASNGAPLLHILFG